MEELPVVIENQTSIGEVLADQINFLLAILARLVVQRQLLAVLVILLISWLLPEAFRHYRARRKGQILPNALVKKSWWRHATVLVYPLFAPIVSLILVYLTILIFAGLGYPNGILKSVASLFFIWLGFRFLLTILFARYGDSVRPYQRWIFTPIFALTILFLIFGRSPATTVILDIPILTFGGVSVTLNGFFFAGLTLYAFLIAGWLLEQFINKTFPQRFNAESGEIKSVASLIRYFIIGLGIVIAFAFLGFDATSLAIVAGSLLVGIGIGLQEIVANFISGFTLLFEQSLRPGDVIEIDGRVNEVERINLRATIVRTLDNTELIIPNATFTTAQVANLTRGGRLIRTRLPFGVAYNSNPDHVRQIATETALEHELTLATPAPVVLHRGFGDSALNFELAVWMEEPKLRERYRSDIYYRLLKAFKENGIEIPFPQRDLHFRSQIAILDPLNNEHNSG